MVCVAGALVTGGSAFVVYRGRVTNTVDLAFRAQGDQETRKGFETGLSISKFVQQNGASMKDLTVTEEVTHAVAV